MYDIQKAYKVKESITLEWVLTKVTEYDIYASYIGHFKIGMIYNSPFRKDKNPSFGLFFSRSSNQLMFKDHGTGDCGNVIKFVSLLTGKLNYNDILSDIVTNLNITKKTTLDNSTSYTKPEETVIGIVRQPMSKLDYDFWGKFAITKQTLHKYDIHSIKYYLCNGVVKSIYRSDNPMYAYKVYNNFKIYKPYADKYTKWRNNLTPYDIQGFAQLPKKGNILFITKSMKDVMCMHELGYHAISPTSESTFIPDELLEDVKSRFKRIIILFDRDVAGVRYSRKMSLKTGLEAMFMHKKFKTKDVSDTILEHGFETVKQWFEKVI